MKLDIQKIRTDFPILSTEVNKKPLIYFDNGATTQKPKCVIDSITNAYNTINANVHRGVHTLSQEATNQSEEVRELVKEFINAKHTHEIIFTKGTTESINLIAHSFCQKYCNEGNEIITTEMEHHANIVPWQLQKDIRGVNLKVLPITDEGELKIEELEKIISPKTKLITLTYVSNVLGTINPIKKVIKIAHKHNIPVLIDAAQAIQHHKIDVQELDCDFLVFSAHKAYGPTGVGVLYGKEKYLNDMPPYQGGGEMIGKVSFEKTTFNELPFKFEAGTPNYIDIIAFGEALSYLNNLGMTEIEQYEKELLDYATKKLTSEIQGLKIYGTAKEKSGVISFLIEGIHPYDVGMFLDKMGIAVRTGHHCAEPLMHRLGIDGTVRASFAFYNTKEEIDQLVEGLKKIVTIFS